MKYKCNACENQDACFHEYGGFVSPRFCPYGYSTEASWVKITPAKPPTPAGGHFASACTDKGSAQHVIVEKGMEWWHCRAGESEEKFSAFLQAIEDRFKTQEARVQTLLSKVGELEAEIKEVDNRRYRDHIRINERDGELETLKAEIGKVGKEWAVHFRNHEACHDPAQEALERKVKHLDREVGHAHERCHDYWKYLHPLAKKAGLFEVKPQPSVAQAPDKDGKILTPGIGVFLGDRKKGYLYLFTGRVEHGFYHGIALNGPRNLWGAPFWIREESVEHVFDLPAGGDK